ncbi:MAG: hypothetical protein ABUS54_08160 [Actinomycetota bacterium]
MKLAALFALVACLTGAGTYAGARALHHTAPVATQLVSQRDTTPTAAQFAEALVGAAGQVAVGETISNTHCVKASPAHYMCAYVVVKPLSVECHLMQGLWTPGEASTITVTLAGQVGRCDSVRSAIQSLG